MEIFEILAIGIVGVILVVAVKAHRPEFALLVSIAVSLVILAKIATGISNVFSGFYDIAASSGIDMRYFSLVIKIIAIAYVTQFTAEICRDAGENAVATKLELSGKIFVMFLTLPIISEFLGIIIEILQ